MQQKELIMINIEIYIQPIVVPPPSCNIVKYICNILSDTHIWMDFFTKGFMKKAIKYEITEACPRLPVRRECITAKMYISDV